MSTVEIPVDAVVFRDDLYPRIETSAVTVQKYAEDLDVLPPVEVSQHNELIDGWHRWTAHMKQQTSPPSIAQNVFGRCPGHWKEIRLSGSSRAMEALKRPLRGSEGVLGVWACPIKALGECPELLSALLDEGRDYW